jgi:4-amino-4-deoxy-L-arabinose transferase-like glycosyltransferase
VDPHGATALEPISPAVAPEARPRLNALSRAEPLTLVALFGAMVILRIAYASAYPIDSDEPQHLHVAWAWTKGLLPYRDVFDNHAPLFHILSAPLVALIGEDPRILVFMRLAMIPLFAAALAATFLVGRRLFGARAGLWAAAICGLSPTFFFKSLEYRTDVLWAAVWVLAIAVVLCGPLEARRGFGAGILFGCCLAVSLKSVMLFSSLAFASMSVLLLLPRAGGDARRRALPYGLSVLAGALLPPAAIVLYFASRGALGALVDCTIRHNLLPGVGRWGYSIRIYLLVPILALLLAAARFIMKRFPGDGARVAFLLLLAGSQYVLLSTVWPVHTRQDLLPFYPLFAPLVAGALLAGSAWIWTARRAALVPGFLACLELVLVPALSPVAAQGTEPQERRLREVLALTGPQDFVLDLKGQAVFRNRPFYYALETMTLERMSRGLIRDTIPERCIETGTCVAPADIAGFPPRARRFLQDYYVVVGAWRVVGAVVDPATAPAGAPLRFDIPMRARYAVVAESGGLPGAIDGLPYDRPRDLLPGHHELQPVPGSGRVAILWAQAVERGFSPFAPAGAAR